MIPNLDCDKDCRFQEDGFTVTTCMYFPPVYDKNGNNTNPDGNTTSGKLKCTVCNRRWSFSRRYGETSYQEIVNVVE